MTALECETLYDCAVEALRVPAFDDIWYGESITARDLGGVTRNALFANVTRRAVARNRALMRRSSLPGGIVLFRAGQHVRRVYLLVSGACIVRHATMRFANPGTFLGYDQLLGTHALATVETFTRCGFVSIDSLRLREIIDNEPAIAFNVLRRLQEELQWHDSHRVRRPSG